MDDTSKKLVQETLIPGATLFCEDFVLDEAVINDQSVKLSEFAGSAIVTSTFTNCSFKQVAVYASNMCGNTWNTCTFSDCNVIKSDMDYAECTNSTITNSKFFRVSFYEAKFENVVFENVDFSRVMFLHTVFKKCTFNHCVFNKGSDLDDVRFIESVFTDTVLDNDLHVKEIVETECVTPFGKLLKNSNL